MTTATPSKSGYAPLNDIELYYEIYGTGDPLILLHGGLGGILMFDPILATLAQSRQVIGVELQAHAHTPDIDRPITCEDMADDVAELVSYLGLETVDVLGYSFGGGVAQQIAIRHPEVVRKLIVLSSGYKRTGYYPQVLEGMAQLGPEVAELMKPSPIYQHYAKVAPNPDDWSSLVTKVGNLLRNEYDWSEGIAKLDMPVLLIVGDADSLYPSHIIDFFGLLGGGKRDAGLDGSGIPDSQLAILPGMTHYNILEFPHLSEIVIRFLNK